jgi:hypothetical protein
MQSSSPSSTPTARDVLGAWLFCLLLGLVALALTTKLEPSIPLAAEFAGLSQCSWAAEAGCQPMPEAVQGRHGVVAGLHRAIVPIRRPSEQHHPS